MTNQILSQAINDPTQCPYYLMSRVTLMTTSALRKGFVDAGIPWVKPAYLGVLLTLWNCDGLKVVDLGRGAGLEPSTMTGLLDRMERDKLLERRNDPEDRRAQRIFLTDIGKQVRDCVMDVVNQVLASVFEGISMEEIDQLKNTLTRILSNAKKQS